jgi:hypothetical protein
MESRPCRNGRVSEDEPEDENLVTGGRDFACTSTTSTCRACNTGHTHGGMRGEVQEGGGHMLAKSE